MASATEIEAAIALLCNHYRLEPEAVRRQLDESSRKAAVARKNGDNGGAPLTRTGDISPDELFVELERYIVGKIGNDPKAETYAQIVRRLATKAADIKAAGTKSARERQKILSKKNLRELNNDLRKRIKTLDKVELLPHGPKDSRTRTKKPPR